MRFFNWNSLCRWCSCPKCILTAMPRRSRVWRWGTTLLRRRGLRRTPKVSSVKKFGNVYKTILPLHLAMWIFFYFDVPLFCIHKGPMFRTPSALRLHFAVTHGPKQHRTIHNRSNHAENKRQEQGLLAVIAQLLLNFDVCFQIIFLYFLYFLMYFFFVSEGSVAIATALLRLLQKWPLAPSGEAATAQHFLALVPFRHLPHEFSSHVARCVWHSPSEKAT